VENAAFFDAPSADAGTRVAADDRVASAFTVGLTDAKRQRAGANIERTVAIVYSLVLRYFVEFGLLLQGACRATGCIEGAIEVASRNMAVRDSSVGLCAYCNLVIGFVDGE